VMDEDSGAGGRITGWERKKQMQGQGQVREQKQMREQGHRQKILWAFACATTHISLARKGGDCEWNA
jgi:hypothetical protein